MNYNVLIILQLKYSLYGAYAQNFSIDQSTGAITTRSSFDREASTNHYYLLNVRVDDGYPSARPSANGQPNMGKYMNNKLCYISLPVGKNIILWGKF